MEACLLLGKGRKIFGGSERARILGSSVSGTQALTLEGLDRLERARTIPWDSSQKQEKLLLQPERSEALSLGLGIRAHEVGKSSVGRRGLGCGALSGGACFTFLGVLEEPLHSGPLDRGLAAGRYVSKDIALLHARGNQRVQLQLCGLARGTHAGVTQWPHEAILTRKVSGAPLTRRFAARRLYETPNSPALRRSRQFSRSTAQILEVACTGMNQVARRAAGGPLFIARSPAPLSTLGGRVANLDRSSMREHNL